MLVFRRKESQSIVLGNDVVVTVSKIHGNRVKLAIQAPGEVRVARGETSSIDAAQSTLVEDELPPLNPHQ